MEKMSDKELATLRDLQAKAKRIEREHKKLLADADEIKDELLERWGVAQDQNTTWKNICAVYGISPDDVDGQEKLYNHIISDRQINYYMTYRT